MYNEQQGELLFNRLRHRSSIRSLRGSNQEEFPGYLRMDAHHIENVPYQMPVQRILFSKCLIMVQIQSDK